jgi:hypothetical protein
VTAQPADVPAPDRHPVLRQTVLDAVDHRRLAEFYRRLLGFTYRPGDQPGGPNDGDDWYVLHDAYGHPALAFQQVPALVAPTWPEGAVPQQLHLDLTVRTVEALTVQRDRALQLGATLLADRSGDEDEPLYVLADPAGHPLCIFVAAD